MIHIYLIRHGETENNMRNEVHQRSDTPLASRGIEQSRQLAACSSQLPIAVILTSPLQRALQTATMIVEKKNIPLLTDKLLIERKQPSEIVGKSYNDPEVDTIHKILDKHFGDPDFHFSDEENFDDLKKRAMTFLHQLEKRSEEHIAVVTHRHFIRMLLGVMAFGKDYPVEVYLKFDQFMYTENASMTTCCLQRNKWQLLSFNDISYLSG